MISTVSKIEQTSAQRVLIESLSTIKRYINMKNFEIDIGSMIHLILLVVLKSMFTHSCFTAASKSNERCTVRSVS